MVMAVTLRRFTVDEIDRFPPDGNRYELLDGVLFVTPAPLPGHEAVVSRINHLLLDHLKPWSEIWIATKSEVVLRPHQKLEPDLQVYRAARIPSAWSQVDDRWLAVEVASPSTRVYDREYKLNAYLSLGVREVWLVDPADRSIVVGRRQRPAVTVRDELVWRPPDPAGSLRLEVPGLFRGLPPE